MVAHRRTVELHAHVHIDPLSKLRPSMIQTTTAATTPHDVHSSMEAKRSAAIPIANAKHLTPWIPAMGRFVARTSSAYDDEVTCAAGAIAACRRW